MSATGTAAHAVPCKTAGGWTAMKCGLYGRQQGLPAGLVIQLKPRALLPSVCPVGQYRYVLAEFASKGKDDLHAMSAASVAVA